MKKLFYFLLTGIAACLLSFTSQPLHIPAFLLRISNQLTQYNQMLPAEKVYVQLDKPFYVPGDDIWFKAYLRDGVSHQVSATSQIVYAELINPKGAVEKTLNLVARKGQAAGDFRLDENAPGGTYKIRAYTTWMKNFGEEAFFEKEIPVQAVLLPRLLMRMEFERKAYGASDPVKAELRLASLENKPLVDFSYSYVVQLQGKEWIKGKGRTDIRGLANIRFNLPPELDTNDGLLNVMIDYQGSTESISRSVPIVLNRIDLQFFPEGGDLVRNVESRVAFKALNEFGKPADIQGRVLDKAGRMVAELSSFHQGMGAFVLRPQDGQTYRVQITKPVGVRQEFQLPIALEKGYGLSVKAVEGQNTLQARIHRPLDQPGWLVAQVRGKLFFSQELNPMKGETTVNIPVRDLPAGVVQITLFDHKEIPHCERLAFVNKHKQLHLEISTDKDRYLPREKVNMTVRVKDEDGLPAPAQLSLSVVDDKLISFADGKQDNILSWLLLSSDLKGKVEEPEFYFRPNEPKADQALDYLLMTQGWRRFEWTEVLNQTPDQWQKKIVQAPEQTVLKGRVLRLGKQEPLAGAKVTVLETEESTLTDATGRFHFADLDLSTPLTLQATAADGYSRIIQVNDYAQEYLIGNTVSGRVVYADDKSPIPGVSVLVKGTATGAITDANGYYHLELPDRGQTLVFSFIGFTTKEVHIGLHNTINASLEADIKTLSEVVVVGYGMQAKRDFTGAATRQKKEQKKQVMVQEVMNDAPVAEMESPVMADQELVNDDIRLNAELVWDAPSPQKNEANPAIEAENVYTLVEEMPKFRGGEKQLSDYLQDHIQYPDPAARQGVEGTVFVHFTVQPDGAIADVNVIKGLSPAFNQEAIRLVAGMPKWQPGRQNGRPVPVRYVLPVRFSEKGFRESSPGGLLLRVASRASGTKAQPARYYRSRSFYVPRYNPSEKVETRTDFRQTIYWNPNLEVDKTGEATVSFYNSDEVTAFRATAEGIAPDGTIGRGSSTYFTQLPFSMDVKLPSVLAFEDQVSVPVVLKNNTDQALQGALKVTAPAAFKSLKGESPFVKINPNSTATVYLSYAVAAKAGKDKFSIQFESQGLSDAFEQPLEIKAKGFPVVASFSGNELEKRFAMEVKQLVPHSMKARLTAYPDVLTDLMSGIESILNEPYGCFEQTSSSTYPNILALQYMRETGTGDAALREKAAKLIEKGYSKLISFETKQKGYEWFGSVPAHEGLTAYGLMEFKDMQEVYASVDAKMVSRTAAWLLGRRNGQGGFNQDSHAIDQFGAASEAVSNAYIVYALSEAGYQDIQQETDAAFEAAMQSKDAYQLALVANALLNLKKKQKAQVALAELIRQMNQVGIDQMKANHSITRSYGKSLQVETASLMALAFLKTDAPNIQLLRKVVQFLAGSRSGGGFGSTQATILALKALTQYARFAKQTADSGTIEVYLGDRKIASKAYEKGAQGEIVLDGLEKYLGEGAHPLTVRFAHTHSALPYSLDVRWSTYTPRSQPECQVALRTQMAEKPVQVGETTRMQITLKNKTGGGLPMTVALVGIPSGLSAQPWQLKELQEKGRVDFYEVQKNYVILYYRSLAPTAQHQIALDLKAEIPGNFEAPASSAYLYYTSEYKAWAGGERVLIGKK